MNAPLLPYTGGVPRGRDYKPEEMLAAILAGEERAALSISDARGAADWATVARLGGIGDNLIASSVFPILKKKYAHLEVIAAKPQSCVFFNNPHIDKLEEREQGDPTASTPGGMLDWQTWFANRAKGSAFFQNLSHTCEAEVAFFPAQTNFYRTEPYRRWRAGHSYLEVVARACAIEETYWKDLSPGFFPTDQEAEQAEKTKAGMLQVSGAGKLICWVLSGTRVDKIWPYAPIAISRIIRELNAAVVMVGAPGRDLELARQIQENVKISNSSDRGLFLGLSPEPETPTWPIRRVLAMPQYSDLVITPDTGPGWACATRPVAKLLMLSHASEENIAKYWINTTVLAADPTRVPCRPCHLLHDTLATCKVLSGSKNDKVSLCMEDISVETMLSAVRKSLNGQTKNLQPLSVEDHEIKTVRDVELTAILRGENQWQT